MRRLQPKPKVHAKVPIPADLRDALREVHELIEQAERDPDIMLDFGGAIQVRGVCGGRFGTGRRPYVLTYFPEDGVRQKWLLTFHPTEIEDIADAVMTEITLYSCTTPDCRCKFREADGHCFYCDYLEEESAPGSGNRTA